MTISINLGQLESVVLSVIEMLTVVSDRPEIVSGATLTSGDFQIPSVSACIFTHNKNPPPLQYGYDRRHCESARILNSTEAHLCNRSRPSDNLEPCQRILQSQ